MVIVLCACLTIEKQKPKNLSKKGFFHRFHLALLLLFFSEEFWGIRNTYKLLVFCLIFLQTRYEFIFSIMFVIIISIIIIFNFIIIIIIVIIIFISVSTLSTFFFQFSVFLFAFFLVVVMYCISLSLYICSITIRCIYNFGIYCCAFVSLRL